MTAAARKRANGQAAPGPSALAVFAARASARATLWQCGELGMHEAVDQLQHDAERDALVAEIGADEIQRLRPRPSPPCATIKWTVLSA
jgi:hypothetical protein